MRAFGPRNSAYAFLDTTDIHTDIPKSRLNTPVWGSPNKQKRKANLEEGLLAGGTVDGYKIQIPAPIKKNKKEKANLEEDF